MIRITIERAYPERPARTIVKEFADVADASNWMVQDSYFDQSYTTKLTWERIEKPTGTHPFTSAHGGAMCTGYRPGPDGVFVPCGKRAEDPIHAVPTPPSEVTRVYTFGYGTDRRDRFVEITAETIEHTRAIMLNHFGNAWAFDYSDRDAAGVGRFGLIEIPRHEWPASSDEYTVNKSGVCVRR